jgi:hypothetical protein
MELARVQSLHLVKRSSGKGQEILIDGLPNDEVR